MALTPASGRTVAPRARAKRDVDGAGLADVEDAAVGLEEPDHVVRQAELRPAAGDLGGFEPLERDARAAHGPDVAVQDPGPLRAGAGEVHHARAPHERDAGLLLHPRPTPS